MGLPNNAKEDLGQGSHTLEPLYDYHHTNLGLTFLRGNEPFFESKIARTTAGA